MAPLAFIDTETTSLRPDRRAWEIGLITRIPATVYPDGQPSEDTRDVEYRWLIDAADLDLGNADLNSLKVGRFHDRHPQAGAPGRTEPMPEADVLAEVERLTRGAHLVGAVVSFDAEVLAARMRAHGICPSGHYHLIDVEALAVGCLSALHRVHTWPPGIRDDRGMDRLPELIGPPWKSDDLAAALGVTISEQDRHTALGDARFARDIYDAVMGGPR